MAKKFSIYKYVRIKGKGWRYCKAAFHDNGKIKPNIVIVGGDKHEEKHPEGSYYLATNGQWIPVGEDALEAQHKRKQAVTLAEYHRLSGTVPAVEAKPAETRETLQGAIDAYLAEIELAVRSKNKRPRTFGLLRCTLEKFAEFTKLQYVKEITHQHLDQYAAWVIETSRTHSTTSGHNEYLRLLQFLKNRGITLRKKNGDVVRLKDGPKIVKNRKVVVNTDEEIEKFFAACEPGKQRTMFLTFQRSGLRKMELATLRPEDAMLDGPNPRLVVCARTVDGYEFVPKWYAEREVSIDPVLVGELRKVKANTRGKLLFGRTDDRIDYHIHRTSKQIARRAGLQPSRFKPHRFRANFATHCLRNGMDLDTLRAQLGHRDTESLRKYITALEGEERAAKVAQVMATAAA